MKNRLTNRALADLGGFSLPQVRRWAVLVLGRDPQADKSKGVKRRYGLDEAYKIYLAGSLITVFNKSLEETKTYLNYIWPALKREKLLPSQLLQENDLVYSFKEDFYETDQFPRYTLVLQPHGQCHLIKTSKFKQININTYQKTFKYIPIFPEDFNDIFSEATEGLPQWNVFLDDSLYFFLRRIFHISGTDDGANLWDFLIKFKESHPLFP